MNRFEQTKLPLKHSAARAVPIIIFIILLLLFLGGISSVRDTTSAKQLESLETALSRSIAQCYATEGSYPATLDYLVSHYGLTYDEESFLIDYTYYGNNLLPDVTVLQRRGH